MTSIAHLRQEYSKEELSENSVSHDPMQQFGWWFEEALKGEINEPNAFALGTATPDGSPSVRIVLLKGFDEQGFVFYSNYESRKGQELKLNPRAAMTFFWHALERQVRVEGIVEMVSTVESDAYYVSRPAGSRLGAWASPQSSNITKEDLEKRLKQITEQYGENIPPRPPFWGGYRIKPHKIEFWQGRPSRLHDRIVYTLINNKWHLSRIAP